MTRNFSMTLFALLITAGITYLVVYVLFLYKQVFRLPSHASFPSTSHLMWLAGIVMVGRGLFLVYTLVGLIPFSLYGIFLGFGLFFFGVVHLNYSHILLDTLSSFEHLIWLELITLLLAAPVTILSAIVAGYWSLFSTSAFFMYYSLFTLILFIYRSHHSQHR